MQITKMPEWATHEVANWRKFATIPATVSDDAIYTVVQREGLIYSSGQSDEDNQFAVAYLRQELGLEGDNE